MTPEELRNERDALGLTSGEMAAALGVSSRDYEGWELDGPVPALMGAALETAKRRINNARLKIARVDGVTSPDGNRSAESQGTDQENAQEPESAEPKLPSIEVAPRQADNDEHLISLWLHGKSEQTQRTYAPDVGRFNEFVGHKPLSLVTVGDLRGFLDSLAARGLADASRAKAISAIKSLLAYAHKVGYLRFNAGAVIEVPAVRNRLSERILTEAQVLTMFALEKNPRDHAILRTLYLVGLRVSELVAMRWRDLIEHADGEAQVNVFGKGSKTRVVIVVSSLWKELCALREGAGEDDPVFRSRQGGHALCPERVTRIVRAASERAGIDKQVSGHWLRHGFASHSLDRGARLHEVQHDLGHASPAITGRYASKQIWQQLHDQTLVSTEVEEVQAGQTEGSGPNAGRSKTRT
jgi:site-specific recombinase XerD